MAMTMAMMRRRTMMRMTMMRGTNAEQSRQRRKLHQGITLADVSLA